MEQSVTIEQKKEHVEEGKPTATNESQAQEPENNIPLHGNSTANVESEGKLEYIVIIRR